MGRLGLSCLLLGSVLGLLHTATPQIRRRWLCDGKKKSGFYGNIIAIDATGPNATPVCILLDVCRSVVTSMLEESSDI